MCDEAIESFMKGSFQKYERVLDKLETLKT